ncbi:MAG: hypothetical protein K2H09_08910 [Treponemataceae bacterium]|nr:hypothetical protein [Treponemataceae bacterium]
MRKPLQLALCYLWILIASSLVGVFVCFQFFICTNFVAGQAEPISFQTIVHGFFEASPVVLLFLGMLVALYKVRHLGSPVLSAAVYAALCAATWLLLFPALLTARGAVYEKNGILDSGAQQANISGGYFRQLDGSIYYFLRDSDGQEADVILLNAEDVPSDEGGAIVRTLDVSEQSEFMKKAAPFRDPLIKESLETPSTPVFAVLVSAKRRALASWSAGIPAWLCFCTFGFALCSVYSFIHVSTWRLVNSFSIVCLEAFVLWGNALYFSPLFGRIRESLEESAAQSVGRWSAPLGNLGAELPPALLNLLLGIIIVVSGSVITVLRNRKD